MMDSARLEAELDTLSDGLQISNDEESVQKLRELLQCPVCLEIPLPPIFLCKRGHIVCSACQDRTYYCPLCREEYSNTRSFVAEGLIDNFTMKCKFRSQGCGEVLKGSAMVNHVKTCDYRPARCLYCHGEQIPYGEFFEHMRSKHKVDGVENKEGCVKYSIALAHVTDLVGGKYCWSPTFFKCFGHTFLFQLHVAHGIACGWICLLGTGPDCNKFEAAVGFQGEKFKVQWEGQVNSFREDPLKTVCKVGGGLLVPFEVIRANVVVNRTEQVLEWGFHVFIHQKTTSAGAGDSASANGAFPQHTDTGPSVGFGQENGGGQSQGGASAAAAAATPKPIVLTPPPTTNASRHCRHFPVLHELHLSEDEAADPNVDRTHADPYQAEEEDLFLPLTNVPGPFILRNAHERVFEAMRLQLYNELDLAEF